MAVQGTSKSSQSRGAGPAASPPRAAASSPQQWLATQWKSVHAAVAQQTERWARAAAMRVPAAPLKPAARSVIRKATKPSPAQVLASQRKPSAVAPQRATPQHRSASRPAAVPARQSSPVQGALNATVQFFGVGADALKTSITRRAQKFANDVVAQARAVETSPQGKAAREVLDVGAGIHWRLYKPLASPLVGALSRTPVGQALAKAPLAKAIEGLDRRYSGELDAVAMATRADFARSVKPQDRQKVARAAQQISAQHRLLVGDRATESSHDAGKSLLQGGIDRMRWVLTGRRDDMDHLLSRTENRLDRLQHDVMTGKVSASGAKRQLDLTTQDYYGEYVRIQTARVGQYDVGIPVLQGIRGASQTVLATTAGARFGPAGGVAVGSLFRDVDKAAHEWSAGVHGVAAPRGSVIRYGVDVARGEKFEARTGKQVLQSFGQDALRSAVDVAAGRFSMGRTAALLQGGTFTAGRVGTARAAAVAQSEAHLMFRAPLAVGQAAAEAAQEPRMTLQQKVAHVRKAALVEVTSLPFTYLGAGLGIRLDGGKTLLSAARQMMGDALTGLADQATRTGVFDGRVMTASELFGTLASTAVGGLNNFSQHPRVASTAAAVSASKPFQPSLDAGMHSTPEGVGQVRGVIDGGSGAPAAVRTARQLLEDAGAHTTLTSGQERLAEAAGLQMSLQRTPRDGDSPKAAAHAAGSADPPRTDAFQTLQELITGWQRQATKSLGSEKALRRGIEREEANRLRDPLDGRRLNESAFRADLLASEPAENKRVGFFDLPRAMKHPNDHASHTGADQILVTFGNIAQAVARDTNVVIYRISGSLFAVEGEGAEVGGFLQRLEDRAAQMTLDYVADDGMRYTGPVPMVSAIIDPARTPLRAEQIELGRRETERAAEPLLGIKLPRERGAPLLTLKSTPAQSAPIGVEVRDPTSAPAAEKGQRALQLFPRRMQQALRSQSQGIAPGQLEAALAESVARAHTTPSGLLNRRGLDRYLGEFEDGSALHYAAFIDVGYLRATNDAIGHFGGDTLLTLAHRELGHVCEEINEELRLAGHERLVAAAVAGDEMIVVSTHSGALGLLNSRYADALESSSMRGQTFNARGTKVEVNFRSPVAYIGSGSDLAQAEINSNEAKQAAMVAGQRVPNQLPPHFEVRPVASD